MNLKEERIIADARALLDLAPEYAPMAAFEIDPGTEIQGLFRQNLPQTLQALLLQAPPKLLDADHSFKHAQIHWDSGQPGFGSGWIELPQDFLRLVLFQMSDWNYPVTEPIHPGQPAYAMQKTHYTGVRGSRQRPVVAVVPKENGKILEFYASATPGAAIAQAAYCPLPKITDGAYAVPDRLVYPLTIKLAADTAAVIGEADKAAALNKMLLEHIL